MTDASVSDSAKDLENLSLNNSGKESSETPGANATFKGVEAASKATSGEDSAAAAAAAPTSLPSDSSLYVGELDPSVSEATLFEAFNPIGPVASIRVCRDAVSRESLGYAYVNYQKSEDAKVAMEKLNYASINGRSIRIMWSQRDPSVRRSGKGNVFIKNLNPAIDNKALHDTFAAFGEILSAKVVTDSEGNSLGFGFIHYASSESAEQAIRLVNGMELIDRELYVAYHVPRSERENKSEGIKNKFTNVYVKNLDPSVDQKGLEEMFSKFGEITSAVVSVDADGSSRGFGFVNFADHEAAKKAVDALNDTETGNEGRKLYVGRAQNKVERQTELKKQHEIARQEKLTKYQGVNLYVKNLDDSIDDEKLKEAFTPFGNITSAKVMVDDFNNSRGFGFVCYSSPEEANLAISEMNQHLLVGKPLYVALAQRKDLRQNQMRQQVNARNQLRLQQQAAVAGAGSRSADAPIMYSTFPSYLNVPGFPNFPRNGQHTFPARGIIPPISQWGTVQGPMYSYSGLPGQLSGSEGVGAPLSKSEKLGRIAAALPEEAGKQFIGESLYPEILALENINNDSELARKITGMLLDMDNEELMDLFDDTNALKDQVDEALSAYNAYLAGLNEDSK